MIGFHQTTCLFKRVFNVMCGAGVVAFDHIGVGIKHRAHMIDLHLHNPAVNSCLLFVCGLMGRCMSNDLI